MKVLFNVDEKRLKYEKSCLVQFSNYLEMEFKVTVQYSIEF